MSTDMNMADVANALADALHEDLKAAYINGLKRAAELAESETDGDNRPWDGAIRVVVEAIEKEIARVKS